MAAKTVAKILNPMENSRVIIKGTILTFGEKFYVGDDVYSSIMLSVINSWSMHYFENNGQLKQEQNESISRQYGKIKFAVYGFTDDLSNISINYCLLKETLESKTINSHKANLYIALIIENIFTNLRSLYDFLFHFIKISLSEKQIKSYPQTDSLNNLISFSKKENNKAKLPEWINWYLNSIENDLNDIRLIRDSVVHKGKEVVLTRKDKKLLMRIPKTVLYTDDNLLPNILNCDEVDYDVKEYLQKLIKKTFENIEILGVIISNKIFEEEKFPFYLFQITNYCMEDFNEFLRE